MEKETLAREPMRAEKAYVERPDRAIEREERFSHVMALTLNPQSGYQDGIIRCITSREGDVQVRGYVDRSELHRVRRNESGKFEIGERLAIAGEDEMIEDMIRDLGDGWECIGLEDPDIFIDEEAGRMHVYFTLPVINRSEESVRIHLGHAEGTSFDDLVMTAPVLIHEGASVDGVSKEVSIAPKCQGGWRNNLVESADKRDGKWYSVVRKVKAESPSGPWEYGETVFHPAEHDIAWAGEHASPGPLFPKSFIDLGEGRAVGVMNGREKSTLAEDGKQIYNRFSVGLFIYDYEHGKIEWVSPEPLISDSEAKTITFASQFVETAPGKGTLYAHVDDSFVRAYDLDVEAIKKLLP